MLNGQSITAIQQALVVVGRQSVRSKILERKLGFLQRVLSAGSRCVSGRL